jgi:hypothetical protein
MIESEDVSTLSTDNEGYFLILIVTCHIELFEYFVLLVNENCSVVKSLP